MFQNSNRVACRSVTCAAHRGFVIALVLALLCLIHGATASADTDASIAIPDLTGNATYPMVSRGEPAKLFIFVTTDCPIVNSYAPEIERICRTYRARQVHCYLVYVDNTQTASQDRDHRKAYGLTCDALRDEKHRLVKRLKATITPEATVVLPDGTTAYHGRIDNRYIGFGKSRYSATTHELRDALDAVLKHKKPIVSQATSIGCYISPD